MSEIISPHKVEIYNLKTYKWDISFADGYSGLDPYGEIPFAALRVSDEIEKIRSLFREILDGSVTHLSGCFDNEWTNVGISQRITDFEGRDGIDIAEVHFRYPEHKLEKEELVWGGQLHKYYLYLNNIGIFKKIDTKYKVGGTGEFTVLEEHYITITDFPVLREIRDYLGKRRAERPTL